MARVRKDVAKLGAGWVPELEWYAKAVLALQARALNHRTSWRYLGAIHGFNRQTWLDRRVITAADPLPPTAEWDGRMWNQCQHQGWYFLPWHRGYLAAFETIVAQTIVDLGGPIEWALPYWNYFDTGNLRARNFPAVFLEPTLSDGKTANPLAAPPRSGATVLGPVPWFTKDINLNAMGVHRFTSAQRTSGFGGGVTVFAHFGGQTGALESNPHNAVHVIIGGIGGNAGFMSDPNLAGLDPIFWLHHCNIDRLWAAWLSRSGNIQENSTAWGDGPSPRIFEMPDASGNLVVFTPGQTLPGGPLAPTYDDLIAGTGFGPMIASVEDEAQEEKTMVASLSPEPPPAAKLVGANAETVTVGSTTTSTTVRLDPAEADIAGDPVEHRVFLNLENIRGTTPSGVLNVLISIPPRGGMPASVPEQVEPVALFGLAEATSPDGVHGGNGISLALDITDVLKQLAQAGGGVPEQLQVHLEQPGDRQQPPITVERVSIYKQPV
jgi:tyrosinase